MGLAPAEQCERQGIVEEGEKQDRTPGRGRQPELLAFEAEVEPHRGGGDRQSKPDVGQRRNMADRDTDEEKRAAPDHGERAEDQPVGAVHLDANHVAS